ncbi:MAG TPA: alanine--glyoxylate aminotransferase family protein, partial [Dyadobacter sp.]|nr:alanine--glyoxylate aminotransferase family protein [Dyadobacter sp.]
MNPLISFYPGPSKVYPQVENYLHEACKSGVLSVNHRSDIFMEMLENTVVSLKETLSVPAEYE